MQKMATAKATFQALKKGVQSAHLSGSYIVHSCDAPVLDTEILLNDSYCKSKNVNISIESE